MSALFCTHWRCTEVHAMIRVMRRQISLTAAFILAVSLLAAPSAPHAQQLPPRNVDDVLAILEQYRPDTAAVEKARAELSTQPPQGAGRNDLAVFYHRRGRVAGNLGDAQRELADLRRALEHSSNSFSAVSEGLGERGFVLQDLAWAETAAGNPITGIALLREVVTSVRIPPRAMHAQNPMINNYAKLGDFAGMLSALKTAEEIWTSLQFRRDFAVWEHTWTVGIERARALVLHHQGKHAQAEPHYRALLRSAELNIAEGERRRNMLGGATPADYEIRTLSSAESGLARNLRNQGRLAEAEAFARSALTRNLAAFGRFSVRTAALIRELGQLVFEQGRLRDAERLARAAMESVEKSAAHPASAEARYAASLLGAVLVAQARWGDAAQVFDRRHAAIATLPEVLERYGSATPEWGIALARSGRATEAVTMLEGMLRKRRSFGFDDTDARTAELRGFFALSLAAANDRVRAQEEFRAVVPALIEHSRTSQSAETGAVLRQWRMVMILEAWLDFLADLSRAGAPAPAGLDPVAEAFRIADVARSSGVQRSLNAASARAAIRDPALAALARREQDAHNRITTLSDILSRLLGVPPAQRLDKVIADMRRDVEALRKARNEMRAEIQRGFADYASLVDPRPATMADARAALRPGEALVSIYVGAQRTFVWALRSEGQTAFAVVDAGETFIAAEVARLRAALDSGELELSRFPSFDVPTAHRLYSKLLQPVEAGWRGAQRLFVVPHRSLGQLPFALLVTREVAQPTPAAERFTEYRSVPWLVREVAPTQIPSVTALTSLRGRPAGSASRSAFAGFGDPLFTLAQGTSSPGERRGLQVRNLAIAERSVNSATVAQLARLPDTADEILDIATALGADSASSVFLQAAASEQRVKATNLANRRIIAFATHGLVPGDLNGLTQPALALSAPEVTGDATSDGLLTLEEVLELKLDADWVVLSACNTAAGDGAGAEALSGLGSAFFYAGARALLVSNWPVETVSARFLTTEMFRRHARDPALARAEIVRGAMLDMLDTGQAASIGGRPSYSWAHPLFWAPFTLVGDGGS